MRYSGLSIDAAGNEVQQQGPCDIHRCGVSPAKKNPPKRAVKRWLTQATLLRASLL